MTNSSPNLLAFTLARAIVNCESVEMYYEVFTQVFKLVGKVCETPIRWQHIHGEGFVSVTMDMDTKQMPGKPLGTCY
jgi:hypothetical protein